MGPKKIDMDALRAWTGTGAEFARMVGVTRQAVSLARQRGGIACQRADHEDGACPIEYGTAAGYRWHGCRCQECTDAHRVRTAEERQRARERAKAQKGALP